MGLVDWQGWDVIGVKGGAVTKCHTMLLSATSLEWKHPSNSLHTIPQLNWSWQLPVFLRKSKMFGHSRVCNVCPSISVVTNHSPPPRTTGSFPSMQQNENSVFAPHTRFWSFVSVRMDENTEEPASFPDRLTAAVLFNFVSTPWKATTDSCRCTLCEPKNVQILRDRNFEWSPSHKNGNGLVF